MSSELTFFRGRLKWHETSLARPPISQKRFEVHFEGCLGPPRVRLPVAMDSKLTIRPERETIDPLMRSLSGST
jgi:hypothetical protein